MHQRKILRYVQNHVHLFSFCSKLDKIEETDFRKIHLLKLKLNLFKMKIQFSCSKQEQTTLGQSF